MHIPGHLAVAVIQTRLLRPCGSQTPQWPVWAGALLPDVLDKTIGYGLGAMPNGRHYSHNLFSLAGVSAGVGLVWGPPAGRAWFWGHLGHLLADSATMVPWLFPVKKYRFRPGKLRFKSKRFAVELLFLSVIVMISQKHCRPAKSCYNTSIGSVPTDNPYPRETIP
jgi:hypothetical protein